MSCGLDQPFLRLLGNMVLAVPVLKLILSDVSAPQEILWAGMQVHGWIPLAVLTASSLYGNRITASYGRSKDVLYSELPGGVAASVILTLILYSELPLKYLGTGCLLFAAALFEIGIRRGFSEFRLQAYAVAWLSFAVLIGINAVGSHAQEAPWTSMGFSALIAYAACVQPFSHRNAFPRLKGCGCETSA